MGRPGFRETFQGMPASKFTKSATSLFIAVAAAAFVVFACRIAWPSLDRTTSVPSTRDFCGRYVPFPDTARALERNYPGSQTWLDYKPDGSFEFHGIPTSRTGETGLVNDHGTWKLGDGSGAFSLTDLGTRGFSFVDLLGQKPPYAIELWDFQHNSPMRFCINPNQSPLVAAYKAVSVTDWLFQGVIAFSILILPILLPKGAHFRSVGYPFLVIVAWGLWRMAYFDPVMDNDVPGVGYIIAALAYPWIARVIYAVRWALKGRQGICTSQT